MTLTELRALIAANLGADNSVGGDQGFIDDDIEQARLEILLETRAQQREGTLTLTSGTETYTTPSSILAITSITGPGTGFSQALEQVSVEQIQHMRALGAVTSPPVYYYAFAGHDEIIMYPSPGSDTLTVTYVPKPTALAQDSDEPSELPAAYQRAIVSFACREALKRREGAQDLQKIAYFTAEYQDYLAKIRRWTFHMAGPPPRVSWNSVRRSRVPADPSRTLS